MIIGKESPLRKIPSALDRRQALFIEGIRFSVEMADVAYKRLRSTLLWLSKMEDETPEIPSTVSAMLDAWSIVDSLNRLRRLMQNMPGLKGKNKNPGYRLFMQGTEKITELRNAVQHLETSIPGVVDDLNWAVLGSLSWGIAHPGTSEIITCSFMPGIPMGSHPMVNPLDRQLWHLPVDSITIERSGVFVCLSDAMRRLKAYIGHMEQSLTEAYATQIPEEHRGKTHGAGMLLTLVFRVAPEQIVPEDTPDPEPDLPEEPDEEEVGSATNHNL
ncbi:MAG: hypothetical protein JJE04_13800 [Acidobacteriia bacterium]|nr:hypothetical protein [Terriglobia bacterium]